MRTEADLQAEIVTTLKILALDRGLPERRTKLLQIYHIPNGEANGIRGAKAKRMGVRRGMPDLHLPVSHHGQIRHPYSLFIEVKLPNAQVPKYQQLVHDELRAEGNRVEVVRTVAEAVMACSEHLSLGVKI